MTIEEIIKKMDVKLEKADFKRNNREIAAYLRRSLWDRGVEEKDILGSFIASCKYSIIILYFTEDRLNVITFFEESDYSESAPLEESYNLNYITRFNSGYGFEHKRCHISMYSSVSKPFNLYFPISDSAGVKFFEELHKTIKCLNSKKEKDYE